MTTPIVNTTTGRPAPKPPMTDEELRLECAKLAVQSRTLPADVVKLATTIYNFVKSS